MNNITEKANNAVILNIDGLNYIYLTYNSNKFKFLLDSGASICVLFKSIIPHSQIVDKTQKIKISGIGGTKMTLGKVDISFQIGEDVWNHDFHVIDGFGKAEIHGILGNDFFQKCEAKIDYHTFQFSYYNGEFVNSVPMFSDKNIYTLIPPRCEIIKFFEVQTNEDCIILPDAVCEGVYTACLATRPDEQCRIPVRFLNVTDKQITLKNFKPRTENFSNYDNFKFEDVPLSVNRVDQVLDLIKYDNLSKEERFSVQKIVAKFPDVFHLDNDPLSVAKVPEQHIHLQPNATPVYVKPYRLPQSQKAEIHKQIDKMLREGVLQNSVSEWSSPLLVVPKKADNNGNKKWRVVIDYRMLNKVIQNDAFPLPCIDEILDSLSGAMYFTHLDLSQGYYQIGLDKESRKYTAFTTDTGKFELTRLPMGLKVSPGKFARAMDIAMSGLNHTHCFTYLDDICVFGNNLRKHNENLIQVLSRLRQMGLRLNPSKCKFMQKQMLYLGHIISEKGIEPDPEKIAAIKGYPRPKDSQEAKRFVAFIGYYRRFINRFADLAAPLNQLSRKGVEFKWTETCQKSFETLKSALLRPPILQFPNFEPENQFILKTDASNFALGAVLSNGDDRPVAFASRQLTKAERNWPVMHRELLAICWGLKKFRPYVYGRKIQIFTDHRPLIFLFSQKDPGSRMTKFRLALEEHDFTISYLKGIQNVQADALSRVIIESDELKSLASKIQDTDIYAITRAQARQINSAKDAVGLQRDDSQIDHPGFVQLLKPPAFATELKCVTSSEMKKLAEKGQKNDLKLGNLFFDVKQRKIYISDEESRSVIARNALLRDLTAMCTKYKIPELIIKKGAHPLSLKLFKYITKCSHEIKKAGIKISILNDPKFIEDEETRKLIINDFHLLNSGGHAGINRTYNNIKKYYYWTGLKEQIQKFISTCDDCQRFKYTVIKKQPMTITTTATSAFQKIALDLFGPLEEDSEGNRFVLTLQCDLSKFTEAYAIKNKEATTVAKAFVSNFILRYGIPREVISDLGSEFIASVFRECCNILNIKQLTSTAYHHQSVGALEISHKSLGAFLRMQISKFPDEWSTWLPYWSFAYNTTVHTETRYTPYELVFGKHCILPSNVGETVDPFYNFDDYPYELKYRLQRACIDASQNLIASKSKRKILYDAKNTQATSFKAGDKVLLQNDAGTKMQPLYKGPFEIVKDEHPNVILKIKNREVTVHKDRIKMYYNSA